MILQPQQIRILHCEKNLARFLFDFGIVDTTKDDYEQVPSIAVCLQQLTTFTTADNTAGKMTVMLGLPQLWSDAQLIMRTY